jgi:hypothetical protein
VTINFTVDPRGRWSPVQLKHVLAIIEPEADEIGIDLIPIEMTEHQFPIRRYLIVLRCREHGVALDYNGICDLCLRNMKRFNWKGDEHDDVSGKHVSAYRWARS